MILRPFEKAAIRALRARGYSGYFAPRIVEALRKDLLHGAKLGFRRRLWAYQRGFLGDTLINYGLTPENYSEYVPEFSYYKLHPLNGPWSKWIDDKLTMRYVLAPYTEWLPKYYFHLPGKTICRLMDCPGDLSADETGIAELLREKKQLAVKIVAGSGGAGFYKLSHTDGEIHVNDKPVTMEEFGRFLSRCEGYVVTEYLVAHADLRKIYPHTANTIRVCSIHESGGTPNIVGAFIRFGTSKTGAVDNIAAGGILCGIRIEDGALFKAGKYEKAEFVEVAIHPDTGVPIKGSIPHWDAVKEKLLQVCAYIPQLPYLGFDVVITETGFKILEINSHPSPHAFQQYYPLLRNPMSRRFFTSAMKAKGIRSHPAAA